MFHLKFFEKWDKFTYIFLQNSEFCYDQKNKNKFLPQNMIHIAFHEIPTNIKQVYFA